MSGGYFDYVQYRITQAADDVAGYIQRLEAEPTDSQVKYYQELSRETRNKIEECERTLRMAAAMLQRVDWYASGDDGEADFNNRWDKEVVAKFQTEGG